jgi:hypothetical protein
VISAVLRLFVVVLANLVGLFYRTMSAGSP